MASALRVGVVQVLALGCLGIAAGAWLKKKFPLLDRLCIPTSIVGGLVFAGIAVGLHGLQINVEVDTSLRDLMMVAFMTTLGLNARLELVRRGGVKVLLMLGLASFGAVLQNLLGIALAKLLHVNPLVGILSGSVALTGGPATAAAFGAMFEGMGVTGATELATAAATFGIAVAGLVGGYIGSRLIRRHRLHAEAANMPGDIASSPETSPDGDTAPAGTNDDLLTAILLIGVSMGAGSLISAGMDQLHVILPSYIGAMMTAAVIRNLNDRFHLLRISQVRVEECATVALYLFIVMAVLTLQLWKLADLALPLIVMLLAQVALCWLLCVTASFYLMGRNYESAVMASGFCGFMLGITANAVACMEELAEKFSPAPQAFLVVPVVGAFLIDFVNALIITGMANAVR
ncbi:MAG TPA: sodium/glutamate symporter [Candidatus Saccharimonadales bacterium]|jgi:ESS family glutamate:Na+ symporter|nr:sodium/glutamate symporter [Candidatus Saccharimonadales bacterium]